MEIDTSLHIFHDEKNKKTDKEQIINKNNKIRISKFK